MELFVSSLNVVLPLFIMMAAGWLLRKNGLVSAQGLSELNRVNARFFLPVMQFYNICEGDLLKGINPDFVVYSSAATVVIFLLCIFLVPKTVTDVKRQSALTLGIYRSNIAIYGLPLATGIFGSSEMVSNVLMMVSVCILITNFFAIMAVELFKGEKLKLLTLVWRSLRNPITYGLILGVAVQFLPFSLPGILLSPIKSLAAIATPMAFVVLGATFTFKSSIKNVKAISIVTILKLIVTPLLIIPAGIVVFGFRADSLAAMLCVFATPTAVNTLPLIKDAGADDELMGEIIVFTTGVSILTIFGFVYTFKLLGLF